VRVQITLQAARLAGREGVVILAPALPEQGPSAALSERNPDFPAGADLLLDTSQARSPLWGGPERLSLERRIADQILLTSQVCLPGSDVRQRIAKRRRESGVPRFASLAVWTPDEYSDAYEGDIAFLSESGAPAPRGVWLDEYIPLLQARRQQGPAVRLKIGDFVPGFEDYVAALLHHYERRDAIPSGELWAAPSETPRSIRGQLRRPDAVAGFSMPGPQADGCALTAESPSLAALQAAADVGWVVVRATDVAGLSRVLNARHGRLLPTDIAMPRLDRLPQNRRLATRGVDTRDILRIDEASGVTARVMEHPSFSNFARDYFAGRATGGKEPRIALPLHIVQEAASAGDDFAQRLLSRYRERGLAGRRLADLGVLWSAPANRRFVIEDGQVPLRVREIDGLRVVPMQTYYAVEGDEAVPLLLGSRLFGLWARITRSRGDSWTPRFAISKTFETFPILPPFTTEPSGSGARALFLGEDRELARLAAGLIGFAGSAEIADRPLDSRRGRADADERLLHLYGLPDDASELMIARRLVELNQEQSDGVFGQDLREPLDF
jgi:hypothetical protein